MGFTDDLDDSEYDNFALAEFAHELYGSDAFEADLRAAARDVLRDHVEQSDSIDADDLDFDAEYGFEERLFKDGRGGMFLLRGKLVTNAQADLAPGDVVRMQSNRDPEKTIYYVVKQAVPENTRANATKLDVEENKQTYATGGLTPGHVLFDDRYEVSRAYRNHDEKPWTIAKTLLGNLREREEVTA